MRVRQATYFQPNAKRPFTTRQLRAGRYTRRVAIGVRIAGVNQTDSLNSNFVGTHVSTGHRAVAKDIGLLSRL